MTDPYPPQQPPPGYPQPGYPQPGYPQPGYPQPGYPQPGYPQGGYPPPGAPGGGGSAIAVTTKFMPLSFFFFFLKPGQTVELEYKAPLIVFSGDSLGPPPQKYNGLWFYWVLLGIFVLLIICCCGNLLLNNGN